jgi:glutathione S-transferase
VLLFNNRVSGNCYKVRLLAAHLGLELELRELDVVDRSNRAEVLGGLNPALRVPTLVLDDRRPLASVADITLYAYTHVAPEGGFDLGQYPALGPWLERVAAQPGHVKITE